MELLVMIVAALFLLSVLDATVWKTRKVEQRRAPACRAVARRAPAHRPRLPAAGAQPVWRGQLGRTSTASGPRWWWE
jgi:hypothetical protein